MIIFFNSFFSISFAINGLAEYSVTQYNFPSSGYLLLSPASDDNIQLIDNAGLTAYSNSTSLMNNAYDLNFQNNKLTFYYNDQLTNFIGYFGMNQSFQVTDTFRCQNYETDFHDFKLLPNGHRLYIGVDIRTIDMSLYVPGGCPTARVRGYVIQETDASGNSVFQWNTFDHFNITDATTDINLKATSFDYVRCNSIEVDNDGNYLLSSRHFDEITKINSSTGEIIWRMGGSGCVNNQFTFTNDTINSFFGFSHQHCLIVLPNGNFLIFDNGNEKPQKYSRAVEYSINESTKQITKVWEFDYNKTIYSDAMGSVQRFANGNTLIGWGLSSSNIVATEVRQNGGIAFEMSHPSIKSYHVFRYPIKMAYYHRSVNSTGDYVFSDSYNDTYVKLHLSTVQGSGAIKIERHAYNPHNITFSNNTPGYIYPARWISGDSGFQNVEGRIIFDLSKMSGLQTPENMGIYYRPKEGTGSFNYLTTTYDQSTNTISSYFLVSGEYMIANRDLDRPRLVAPANDTIDLPSKVTLKWSKCPSGSRYSVQIALDADFNSVIKDTSNLSDTTLVVTLGNYSKYYWRVKVTLNAVSSRWTYHRNFTTLLPEPDLISPSDGSYKNLLSGVLTWEKIDRATNYKLEISESPDFKNLTDDQFLNSNTTTYNNFRPDIKYYWHVATVNGTKVSNWSKIYSFTTVLDTVHLIEPDYGKIDLGINVLLKWNTVSGAIFYWLQISESTDFEHPVMNQQMLTDSIFVIKNLKYDTKYYWRVLGFSGSNTGFWSDPGEFETKISYPDLLEPHDNDNDSPLNIHFKWTEVHNVVNYQIQIATDSTFQNILADVSDLAVNQFDFSKFKYTTSYFWRVSAKSVTTTSEWSSIFKFITRSENFLDKPSLNIPVNEIYNVDTMCVLNWFRVINGSNYEVQITEDSTFSKLVAEFSDLTDTTLIFTDGKYNRHYYWRVKAANNALSSNWSEVFSYYTKLKQPELLTPLNLSNEISLPFYFSWVAVDGAYGYTIDISESKEFNQIQTYKTDQTKWLFTDTLLRDQNYYWRCKAQNLPKESDWSQIYQFKLKSITDVFNYENNTEELNLYPIPASNYLFICKKTGNFENIEISIYNNLGCKLLNIYQEYNKTIKIPLDDFGNGIYFYIIKNNDQSFKGLFPVLKNK